MSDQPFALNCILCLYAPCHTEQAVQFDEDDPPHDGIAVTVTGGEAVCECHMELVKPSSVSILIANLSERAREVDRERNPS